ncbi:MAG: hypothetical protein M1829_006214 [Trizodia sp. TS-e1964]|nr:MAG: hypothetical protein M1829_006214 [Trizodia sp. TS-e1964]
MSIPGNQHPFPGRLTEKLAPDALSLLHPEQENIAGCGGWAAGEGALQAKDDFWIAGDNPQWMNRTLKSNYDMGYLYSNGDLRYSHEQDGNLSINTQGHGFLEPAYPASAGSVDIGTLSLSSPVHHHHNHMDAVNFTSQLPLTFVPYHGDGQSARSFPEASRWPYHSLSEPQNHTNLFDGVDFSCLDEVSEPMRSPIGSALENLDPLIASPGSFPLGSSPAQDRIASGATTAVTGSQHTKSFAMESKPRYTHTEASHSLVQNVHCFPEGNHGLIGNPKFSPKAQPDILGLSATSPLFSGFAKAPGKHEVTQELSIGTDDHQKLSPYSPLSSATVSQNTPSLDSVELNTLVKNAAIAARRSAEESESGFRSHAYYQKGPGADGLYHCPFEGQDGCVHVPHKLKCNYDKMIDSHLRPYRCKDKSCLNTQFSSTACLLRHEREAHGMHGHGEKLCRFQNCDRSQPGHGFPRSWNRLDHMRRVHDSSDKAPSNASSSPTQSLATPIPDCRPSMAATGNEGRPSGRSRTRAMMHRMQKQKSGGASERIYGITQSLPQKPMARPRSNTAVQATHAVITTKQRLRELHEEWKQKHRNLKDAISALSSPLDSLRHHDLHESISSLRDVAAGIRGLEDPQRRTSAS